MSEQRPEHASAEDEHAGKPTQEPNLKGIGATNTVAVRVPVEDLGDQDDTGDARA